MGDRDGREDKGVAVTLNASQRDALRQRAITRVKKIEK